MAREPPTSQITPTKEPTKIPFFSSLLGLQEGAEKVANAANILNVEIDPDSTTDEFFMQHLSQLFAGVHERGSLTETVTASVSKKSVE